MKSFFLLISLVITGCATNTWIQGSQSTMSAPWDSGKPGTVLSADCMIAVGPLHLFGGLKGFKEPRSNLDRFIARLDIGCIEYRNNPSLGLVQTLNSTTITVTTTSDFRINDGEIPINVGTTGIPVGIRIVHGNKKYVQNMTMMVGSAADDGNGGKTIIGHGGTGGATGVTIPDYPKPRLIGSATQRSNSVRLDCPSPQVMTGIELTVDPAKDKIRKVRLICHPIVFVGSSGN
jgi:hypothetical protein